MELHELERGKLYWIMGGKIHMEDTSKSDGRYWSTDRAKSIWYLNGKPYTSTRKFAETISKFTFVDESVISLLCLKYPD